MPSIAKTYRKHAKRLQRDAYKALKQADQLPPGPSHDDLDHAATILAACAAMLQQASALLERASEAGVSRACLRNALAYDRARDIEGRKATAADYDVILTEIYTADAELGIELSES